MLKSLRTENIPATSREIGLKGFHVQESTPPNIPPAPQVMIQFDFSETVDGVEKRLDPVIFRYGRVKDKTVTYKGQPVSMADVVAIIALFGEAAEAKAIIEDPETT